MAGSDTIEIVVKVRDQGEGASPAALNHALLPPAITGAAAQFAELSALSTKNFAADLLGAMPKLDFADTILAALPKLDLVDPIAGTIAATMSKLDFVSPLLTTALAAIPDLGLSTGILNVLSKPLFRAPITTVSRPEPCGLRLWGGRRWSARL